MRLFLTKKALESDRYFFTEERVPGFPHMLGKWGHVACLLLGSAGLCWSGGAYADDSGSTITIDNSSSPTVGKNLSGTGSVVLSGDGTTTLTGTSVIMNPNPSGSSLPTGANDTPTAGSVVVRDGNVNISGSGTNNGDLSFNASQNNSVSGTVTDKQTGAVVGTIDDNGNVTPSGNNASDVQSNASRLQGFVANNGYTIVGQADRGNLTLSNGAVLASDAGTVNVGQAATSKGSTLTVDNSWLHAGTLTVGNGDPNYNSQQSGSQSSSDPNGHLVVKNGGVVSSGVTVVGNYLGSSGTIDVSGTADPQNHSAASQSTLSANSLYVNGSGKGTVNIGDGSTPNSGLVAVKDGVHFGADPSQDGASSSNSSQLQQKTGTLNLQTGGTLAVSDARDAQGNVTSDAISAASNEQNPQFNLNGGTLQRSTYNDTANSTSPLTTSMNMNLNKTSTIDSNNGQVVLGGQIAGAGGLTKENAGSLILTGQNSYQGDTTVNKGTIQLGNNNGQTGDLGASKALHLNGADSGLVVDRSNTTNVAQSITGRGSLTFAGSGTTNLTGTSVLMNANPNGASFPSGSHDQPMGGSLAVRNGNVNISGSGTNNGDLSFNASQNNSVSGTVTDKQTGAVIGKVDDNGNVTPSGNNASDVQSNASRLQGFVANNGYTIVGQADRGNLTLSNGAVLASDAGTVNVGQAATSKGSTLTVDNSWLHAGTLTVGNGDPNYNSQQSGSQSSSDPNGHLVVKNGGVVSSGVTVVGNYLGSSGTIDVSGTADPQNHSAASQSTLSANSLYVNGSGKGTVNIGDGSTPNSGLVAVKDGVHFGADPSQDGASSSNSSQLQQKTGTLNLQTGGTLAVSDARDAQGNVTSDAISAASNEQNPQFNLNGGTLQRSTYNDTANSTSPLTTSMNMNLNKTSTIDSNNGQVVLGGQIAGAGGLTKENAGSLILTGQNSYQGDTTVNKGTIQLGNNNGQTGDLGASKALHLNGADSGLVVDRSNAVTLDQTISGDGSFTQSGTGTTTLTGDNSYTGETTIQRGDLSVNGNQSQATGQTTVASGGTLSGNGTVGGPVNVQGGGTISAGNGADNGKLTIAGTNNPHGTNLTLQPNATLNANIGSDPHSEDHVASNGTTYHEGSVVYVTGKASFGAGSIVNLSTNPGVSLRYNLPYRVVQTTDGIQGDLSKVKTSQNYIFLNQQLVKEGASGYGPTMNADNSSDADALDVVLRRNGVSYSSVAQTRNERATGLGLDTLSDNSNVAQSIAQIQDSGQARQALNAVSGEVHASVRTALIEDSYYTRQAVMERLVTADCDGITAGVTSRVRDKRTGKWIDGRCVSDRTVWWGQAFGGEGHNDSTGDTAGMNHSTAGFLIGADRMIVDNWRVGGFAGYTRSMMNVGARSSSGNSDNVTFGAYAGKHWGDLHLRTGVSYTWNSINTNRTVAYTGYNDRLHDHQIGGTGQAFAELGYRFHVGAQTRIEPFVNMAYVNLHTNGFTEHGGDAALRGRGTDNSVGYSTFGIRAATRVRVGDATVSPYGMVAYRRAFGNVSPSVHQAFATGSSDMDINGAPLAQDSAVMDVGVQAQLTDMIDVRLSYLGQYGGHAYDNGGRASIRMRF